MKEITEFKFISLDLISYDSDINESKDKDTHIFQLYSLFLDSTERESLSKRYDGQGLRYGDIKQELFEKTMDYFKPYRDQRDMLSKNPTKVYEILNYGAEKAKIVACEVLERVRSSVGVSYKP